MGGVEMGGVEMRGVGTGEIKLGGIEMEVCDTMYYLNLTILKMTPLKWKKRRTVLCQSPLFFGNSIRTKG